MQRWEPGSAIAWRSLLPDGQVAYALCAVVLHDDAEAVVLHQAPGAPCRRRSGRRGGPGGRSMLPGSWDGGYEGVGWTRDVVRAHVAATGYSVIRTWDASRRTFVGDWYINLELPWRRNLVGFDSVDLTLDIVVAEDLVSWRWKDEDELAWKVRVGLADDRLTTAAYAHGRRAIEHLRGGARLFQPDAWQRWTPAAHAATPAEVTGWLAPAQPL